MNSAHPRQPSISAFFPAYNDAGTIASLVVATLLILETLSDDFEVIIVNDGSDDATGQIADRLARDYPVVRVIHHPTNQGYGGALQSGFAAARKDVIFYTDGDAQYDVRELLELYPLLTAEVDVVQGYKLNRQDPLHRRLIGILYHAVVRRLFSLSIRDVDCDFRVIRRRALEPIRLQQTSGAICVELMKKLEMSGCRIVEKGVRHYPRPYGRSQFFRWQHIRATFSGLYDLWRDLFAGS